MSVGKRLGAALAVLVLAMFAAMALFPQLFTAHDPLLTDVSAIKQAPGAGHLLGTDQSGRDVYARIVFGARQSIGVGLLATIGALLIGLVLGVLVGLLPRAIDAIVMRVVDVLLAVPEFLVALVIVALLGPGPINVGFAVMIAVAPVYLRLARSHTMQLRVADHVESARMLGLSRTGVVVRHILPGVFRRLSVLATIGLGTSILAVAGLSFLGLGVAEPDPEWGLMLYGGRNEIARAWWITVFPGLAITLTVVAGSLLGRIARERAEIGGRV